MQFGRFGAKLATLTYPFDETDRREGSLLYVGVLAGVQAAVHVGAFAPFGGLGLGVDHFRFTGDSATFLDEQNLDSSATASAWT